jgi:hypothetical protein
MVDESIALEEMRICEENGPADPVPKALSRNLAGFASRILGIRAERIMAADNLRSYVRDSDPLSIKKAVEQRVIPWLL